MYDFKEGRKAIGSLSIIVALILTLMFIYVLWLIDIAALEFDKYFLEREHASNDKGIGKRKTLIIRIEVGLALKELYFLIWTI